MMELIEPYKPMTLWVQKWHNKKNTSVTKNQKMSYFYSQ